AIPLHSAQSLVLFPHAFRSSRPRDRVALSLGACDGRTRFRYLDLRGSPWRGVEETSGSQRAAISAPPTPNADLGPNLDPHYSDRRSVTPSAWDYLRLAGCAHRNSQGRGQAPTRTA